MRIEALADLDLAQYIRPGDGIEAVLAPHGGSLARHGARTNPDAAP